MRGGAGGDGDVGGGDYHVLQLLRASLSHTHSLFLSLFLSVSPSRQRVPNKSSAAHRNPGYNPAATIASPDDITSHRRDNASVEKALTARKLQLQG